MAAQAIQTSIDLNIGTLGQFGFSTSYIPGPGQQDETPLRQLAKELHGHPDINAVTIGEMTAVRRLYLEASFRTKFKKWKFVQFNSFSQLKAQHYFNILF